MCECENVLIMLGVTKRTEFVMSIKIMIIVKAINYLMFNEHEKLQLI